MSNDLSLIPSTFPALASTDDVYTAFLEGRNVNTMEAYAADLGDFARFAGMNSPGLAVETLLTMGHGSANRLALAYRAHLAGRGLATATIARRIAALRAVVKLARMLGRIEWSLDVQAPKVEKYRDTRGPGMTAWRKMQATTRRLATTPIGKRNAALLALMHDLGLRRGECASLDLVHVDLSQNQVSVLGKGKTDRVWLTLSPQASAALASWISARGEKGGPLFTRLDRAARFETRLTGDSVNRMVGSIGRKAEVSVKVKAHGLRHQAITRLLDLTNGDVRRVKAFSRHADVNTLLKYDDNRQDLAGQLACMLGNDSE